jgi:hypothetical protein
MPKPGVVRALIHNFLGTYASRYSDYRGYWLFGFLVPQVGIVEWNLLSPAPAESENPIRFAQALAIARFSDQVSKARLDGRVLRATLRIERGEPRALPATPWSGARAGYELSLTTEVTTSRSTERGVRVLIVAHHDPAFEFRRHGAT